MKKIDKKYIYIAFGFLSYTFIHWIFPLIFGETPVNIMKLGGNTAKGNYIINFLSFIVITLAFVNLITLIIKDRIKRFVYTTAGILISTIFNALILLFSIFFNDCKYSVSQLVYFL